MKHLMSTTLLLLLCTFHSFAQSGVTFQPAKPDMQADKGYLLDQFRRTKADINQETTRLTSAQWNFREAPGKWTVGEVLEHLTMWELITLGDARYSLYLGPNPKLAALCKSDSATTSFIYEERPHVSPDFTVPTGLVKDDNNLKIFNTKCDQLLGQIEQVTGDFRRYVREGKDGNHRNLAQLYIIQFGHVDRHLRQIRRIKANPNFPK